MWSYEAKKALQVTVRSRPSRTAKIRDKVLVILLAKPPTSVDMMMLRVLGDRS
jgi:hypothetical protein